MSRRLLKPLLLIGLVASALGTAVLGGYYIHAFQVTPLASFIPRVERKLDKIRGAPSQLERDVAVIETTFVQLRGNVMRPPGAEWISGGAMTVRGSDLIIVDRKGRFYATDGTAPIRALPNLAAPENGRAAYEGFAVSPEGQRYVHTPERIRFNDVTWVESGDLTGFALSYTFFDPARLCYGTRIAWADAAAQTDLDGIAVAANDWEIIFQTRPCPSLTLGKPAIEGHFAGGRMAFQPPSTLYLGSGFYGLDGINSPDIGLQSDDNSFGKVIALDLRARTDRIVSRGHRNLQGVAIDKLGRVWVTEHGLRGGDELNLIREGGDYGWPSEGLGTLYSGQPVPGIPFGRHEKFDAPVFAWLPSAAVSSLAVIDGLDPSWDGDLLAGSLSSEEFGQSLWHIRIRGERVIFVERIRLRHRVRYVTQFGNRIAVWLDSNDLVLFDVIRRADPFGRVRAYLAETYDADIVKAVSGVVANCNECHSFAENDHRAGPSLNGVVGRPITGSTFSGYSSALTGLDGRWTPERLAAYLIDPDAVAPGTTMPASGLQEGPVLDALIDAMSRLDTDAEEDLTYD